MMILSIIIYERGMYLCIITTGLATSGAMHCRWANINSAKRDKEKK